MRFFNSIIRLLLVVSFFSCVPNEKEVESRKFSMEVEIEDIGKSWTLEEEFYQAFNLNQTIHTSLYYSDEKDITRMIPMSNALAERLSSLVKKKSFVLTIEQRDLNGKAHFLIVDIHPIQ